MLSTSRGLTRKAPGNLCLLPPGRNCLAECCRLTRPSAQEQVFHPTLFLLLGRSVPGIKVCLPECGESFPRTPGVQVGRLLFQTAILHSSQLLFKLLFRVAQEVQPCIAALLLRTAAYTVFFLRPPCGPLEQLVTHPLQGRFHLLALHTQGGQGTLLGILFMLA